MGCLESLKYEILLKNASSKESGDFIRNHFDEVHEVEAGYKILDKHLIGIPPIAVGVEGDYVIFPYTKPCYGTFLVRVAVPEEVERLRKRSK